MTRYTSGPITIPYPDYREKPYDATIQTTFQTTADEIAAAIAGSTQLIYDTIGTVSAPGELRQNEGTVGSYALAKGFWDPNDGGGDFFSWVVGSAVDDGYYNIVPQGTPSGYWKRLVKGNVINVKGLGARSANPDNGSYINGILSAIGSNKATLYFPKDPGVATTTYAFTTSVSFPSNVHVIIEQGVRFSSATVAVVFNSTDQITAPIDDQIFSFSSSGSFSFTNGGTVYIKWTGAVGNGSTDDTTALDQLITSLDGTKGKIVLTQPSVAYRFAASKTWILSSGTVLEIIGESPNIPIQVVAQLWFFSAEARTATTLAANATRKDQSITVTAASGVQTGDIVWIYTDVDAETSWNYKKTDTHIVKSVSGNVINLDTFLNFSYNTGDSGQSVTIYRPAQFSLSNIKAQFYTSSTRFLFRGIRKGRFSNFTFFDADRAKDLSPIEISRCVDIEFNDFEIDGVLYAITANFCRNVKATNLNIRNCTTSVEAASFCDGVSIRNMYAEYTQSAVQSHPAFNVSFENVISYNYSATGGLQALGVVLRNVYMYSTVASGVGSVYLHSVLMVDGTIYNDYDCVLENVWYDFPNWENSLNSADVIFCYYGNRLVINNTRIPWLNCSVAGNPNKIQIANSEISRLRARTEVHCLSNKFFNNGVAGTYALRLDGSRPFHFTSCHFKNYDNLLDTPVNYLRPFYFIGCYFEGISGEILNPYYTNEKHAFLFQSCLFYNCAANWASPEVINERLRVDNCEFVSTDEQKDFSQDHVLAVDVTGGAVNGYPLDWQNPFSFKLIVNRILFEIITAGGTAGSLMDIGIAASSSTHSDNILDGIDLNPGTVPVIYDSMNSADAGTNGAKRAFIIDENGGANDWITGQVLIAASTNLVAKLYINYRRL